MDDIVTNAEIRRQKARARMGSPDSSCPGCGQDDPECFEKHHIAGRAFHDQTQPLCLCCHRKVTSRQKDHPEQVGSPPSFLEVVGHYLLGLADMLILVAETLVEFGKRLIATAREKAEDAA